MGSPYTYVFNSINVVGFIIILITSIIELSGTGPKSSGNLYGLTMGYTFISVGLLLQAGYLLNNLNRQTDLSGMTYIIHFLTNIGPIVLFIGISLYLSYLLSNYHGVITAGHTTEDFHTLMSIITSFSLMTIVFLLYSGSKKNPHEVSNFGQVMGLIVYLFNTINIIPLLALGAILKYFTTDG